MNIIRKAISLLLFLSVCSCGHGGKLSPAAYVQYLEDTEHGYVRQIKTGAYEYSIQLATPEYIAAKEAGGNDSILRARMAELKGYRFFLIKMGTTTAQRTAAGGGADAQRVSEADAMVAYYDQQAAGDISLKAGANTLQPATYHFEHNYGLAPHNTIVVAFETGDQAQDLELEFNDRFRNIPHIRAGFSQSELSGLPQLTY
jgi:hypothetical protein